MIKMNFCSGSWTDAKLNFALKNCFVDIWSAWSIKSVINCYLCLHCDCNTKVNFNSIQKNNNKLNVNMKRNELFVVVFKFYFYCKWISLIKHAVESVWARNVSLDVLLQFSLVAIPRKKREESHHIYTICSTAEKKTFDYSLRSRAHQVKIRRQ